MALADVERSAALDHGQGGRAPRLEAAAAVLGHCLGADRRRRPRLRRGQAAARLLRAARLPRLARARGDRRARPRAGPARDRRRQARRHRRQRAAPTRRPCSAGSTRRSGASPGPRRRRRDAEPAARPRRARARSSTAARAAGAGVFVLVRTSNPGAADFFDAELAAGGPLWERIAALVDGGRHAGPGVGAGRGRRRDGRDRAGAPRAHARADAARAVPAAGHRRAGRRRRRPRAGVRARAAPPAWSARRARSPTRTRPPAAAPADAARAEAERLRDAGLGARPERRARRSARTPRVSSMPMAGRSPARFLAPLALVAFALALFIVVSSTTKDDAEHAGARDTGAAGAGDHRPRTGREEEAQAAAQLHGQDRRHAVRHRGEGRRPAWTRSSSSTPISTRRRSRPARRSSCADGRAPPHSSPPSRALALARRARRGRAAPRAPPTRRPQLSAPSAILIEASTGEVLYERAADKRRPIASTTKLMTALLTMERAQLSDKVTASSYIAVADRVQAEPAPRRAAVGRRPAARPDARVRQRRRGHARRARRAARAPRSCG